MPAPHRVSALVTRGISHAVGDQEDVRRELRPFLARDDLGDDPRQRHGVQPGDRIRGGERAFADHDVVELQIPLRTERDPEVQRCAVLGTDDAPDRAGVPHLPLGLLLGHLAERIDHHATRPW